MAIWNPWHGCHKLSEGCVNCYMYRQDGRYGKDSSIVTKTSNFEMPLMLSKNGNYKLKPGEMVYLCLTSDFFLPDADKWRHRIWEIIKIRHDLNFCIITKRIDRFYISLPCDWNNGYDNVSIACTVENQSMADYRLPIFLTAPIKHKVIVCEPLLERIELSKYLDDTIDFIVAGGESGNQARLCDYSWILNLRNQCIESDTGFYFKQTGALFQKDEKIYRVARKYQHSQARKSNINYISKKKGRFIL